MTDLRTISPDELPKLSEIPEDLRAVVFSPSGPLQSLPYQKLLPRLIAANLALPTKVALDADLAHDADSVALVFNDPTPALNGWYRKVGASGAGNWAQFEELARSVRLAAESAATLAAEEADRAEAARLAAEAVNNARWFGSVAFPPENGVTASADTSGQVRLTGARTALVGAAGTAAALWGNAQSFMIVLEADRRLADGRNIRMGAIGSVAVSSGTSTSRAFGLSYVSRTHGTAGERGNWYFFIRGETAASSGWLIPVSGMPADAQGPFIGMAWNDAVNGFLSICDTATGTWYDSAAVPKPAGWAGCSQITNEIVVGGDGSYVFPRDNSAARQNSNQWIGAFRDAIFANVVMTKADALAIFNGADPATQLGGAGNLRLHVPGAVNGVLSTAKSGTAAAGVTVEYQGTIHPGPSMTRQGAANYMTVARRAAVLATLPKTRVALTQFSGTHGGTATGTLQVRQVGRSGTVYSNWTNIPNTGAAGNWACSPVLAEAPEACDIQFRFSGAPELIANTGVRHWIKPVFIFHGQSEIVLSVFSAESARAIGTAPVLGVPLAAGAGRVSFGARSWTNAYCRIQSAELPGYLGAEAAAIANIISEERPAHIVVNAISGTSMLALMNDADASREWTDTLARCAEIGNRDANGAFPIHAHIIDWEAFYSGVDGVMRGAYRPLLTGVASNDIAQGVLNRWLFSGEFSNDAEVIIMPGNRASGVNAAGATASDTSLESDQRDQMRNWAHLLGYRIGPERTTHKLQGENAAGGALVSGTHPEDDDWEGDLEAAVFNAEALRMALGTSTFTAPVFFESIRAGSAADKVILRLGNPRQYPGLGLAEDATGYSTAAGVALERAPAIRLHTKRTTGNAGAGFEARRRPNGGAFGAWSKANVTGGTVTSPRDVELTLAWALAAGDTVEVRYHPGTPGAYSTATITQADWRAGALFFTGAPLAAPPASLADVRSIGFAVSGSNQALSFAA
jgi:hypothetical protein